MQLLTKEQFSVFENEVKKLMKSNGELSSGNVTPKGDALGATICTAIDQAAPKLNLSSGSASSFSPVGKQEIAVCQPDKNVAISTLQGFFSKKTGISIALAGESHAYKDPVPVEPQLPRGQGGMVLAMLGGDTDGWTPQMFALAQQEQVKFGGVLQEIRDYPTKLDAYRKSQKDCARAKTLMKQFPEVDLLVLERRMMEYRGYETNVTRKEDDLLGDWSIRQRSTLIAAYIFLCAAGGPSGHVLLIFGEEHKDILDFFEYFATNSKAITNVAHVQRNYCLIKSHVN